MAADPKRTPDTLKLIKFGEDIWLVSGPTLLVAGFPYPTRMVIIRLSDGSLFIWSPIVLPDEASFEAITELGPVAYIVAPNGLHYSSLRLWKVWFPDAKFFAPPGFPKGRLDLTFDGELADTAPSAWAQDIDQVLVGGNLITTEVVFFHKASRTTIFCDLIQHFRPSDHQGWRATVARLDLLNGPEPAVPRKFRLAFVDRPAARAVLGRILAWPTENVVFAHGAPIKGEGKAFLDRAFQWLLHT